MNLLLSGGWIGREGIFRAEVGELILPERLEDIPADTTSFVLLSYSLAGKTLGVDLKRDALPPIVVLPIRDIKQVSLPVNAIAQPDLKPVGMTLGEEEFKEAIAKVKGFIERGDVYQINLTSRIDFCFEGDPEELFYSFYLKQPVPYAFYLDLGDFLVISGSMELFLQKRGSKLVSRPIKGTGSPGDNPSFSSKERAENLMITDMMRNDIGRVALPGSVRVRELFAVRTYETLSQMHSEVEGETRKGFEEIIRATFPPASVTGAPKRRAVEIIDLLEPHARGYYCGSGGILHPNGDFTLSVLIRTAFGGVSRLSYFAGCGIVWDSDPEKEWEELKLKAKAFYPQAMEEL